MHFLDLERIPRYLYARQKSVISRLESLQVFFLSRGLYVMRGMTFRLCRKTGGKYFRKQKKKRLSRLVSLMGPLILYNAAHTMARHLIFAKED